MAEQETTAPAVETVESPRPSIDPGQVEQPKADAPVAAETKPAPTGEQPGQASTEPINQPPFDVQKSYEELRKQFTRVTQDYSRDRKTWNQTLSELKSVKESQSKLAELLSRATEVPVDPAQFMQDLQTQGPKALEGYLKKHVEAATKQIQESYVEQANKALALEIRLEKMSRRMDVTNYPDWDKLEPVMNEIADPDNNDPTPIDWNQPIGLVYDALYKLARSRSSEDAVRAAEQFGKAQAEKQLGKEAATAVPGGGKGGSVTTDPRSMTAPQLRQYFISQGMVEEA